MQLSLFVDKYIYKKKIKHSLYLTVTKLHTIYTEMNTPSKKKKYCLYRYKSTYK